MVIPGGRKPQTPEQVLRSEWAALLADELAAKGYTPKAFHLAVNDARRANGEPEVSIQAIYGWLNGTTAPSPHNMAYCALVLRAPGHRLFPLPRVAS